jgi:hypothetical protein
VALGTATRPGDFVGNGDALKVSLYPNPAKNTLNINITGNDEVKTINVFDVNGKLVMSQQASPVNTALNIRPLSGGIYFLKVTGAGGKELYQQKFIKD